MDSLNQHRYEGDLDELRDHPVFDWSATATYTYLREMDLRRVEAGIERVQQLIAGGARHQDVMGALSAVENGLAKYPDLQREQQAATNAYADEYGLRGWYRRPSSMLNEPGERMYVSLVRTREDGDADRYYVHTPYGGGTFTDGSRAWVVDRDSGETRASFGVGETNDVAMRKARSWIHTAESGGC